MKKRFSSKRFNVFKTILISSILPCFLATIIMGFVFLPMISHSSQANDEAYGESLLYVTASRFDELFLSFDSAVSTVENNSWIHSLFLDSLTGKRPEYDIQTDIQKELFAACLRGNHYLVSFMLYKDDVLYTSKGVYINQPFYEQQYSDLTYRFFASGTKQPSVSTIVHDEELYLLYQAPFRVIPEGNYQGEVNIFVSTQALGKRLLKAVGPDAAAFRLLDSEGNTVWEFITGASEEETVTLTQHSSSGLFSYCVDVPKSVYNQTQKETVPVVLISLVVSMAISMGLCYFLSSLSYRPIQQFVWRVAGQTMKSDNDIEVLERAFDGVKFEKEAVEATVEQLRPIAHQKMLGSLLDGSAFLDESLEVQLENCGIQFGYECFNVVAMRVPFSQVDGTEFTSRLATEILLDALKSQLSLNAYLFYDSGDNYRIILNYRSWEQLQSYISLLSSNVKQFFANNGITEGIYFGIGQVVESAEELYRAAEQADTAIYLAVANRLNQPMFYREIAPELKFDYFYPMSEELLLSRAITNGNRTGAKSLLYAVIDENRQKKHLSPKCLHLLYMDLSSTVSRSGQSLGIDTLPINVKEEYLSLDKICERVENMIDHICDHITAQRSAVPNSTEHEMLNYIDEHLYDPNLSLRSVGDEFQKSASYVSAIFKTHRDDNFNNYVNHARIMRALQLMTDEGLDSNSVFHLVGYSNLKTFRRNFSKYTKQNPGQLFRDSDDVTVEEE